MWERPGSRPVQNVSIEELGGRIGSSVWDIQQSCGQLDRHATHNSEVLYSLRPSQTPPSCRLINTPSAQSCVPVHRAMGYTISSGLHFTRKGQHSLFLLTSNDGKTAPKYSCRLLTTHYRRSRSTRAVVACFSSAVAPRSGGRGIDYRKPERGDLLYGVTLRRDQSEISPQWCLFPGDKFRPCLR